MDVTLRMNRGNPLKDGEYITIERNPDGSRHFHTYFYTVAGGWCSVYDSEGTLIAPPKGVKFDIIAWAPVNAPMRQMDDEDRLFYCADEIEEIRERYKDDYYPLGFRSIYRALDYAIDYITEAKKAIGERGEE